MSSSKTQNPPTRVQSVPTPMTITEHALLRTKAYTFILLIIWAAMSSVLRIEVPSHTENKEHKKHKKHNIYVARR
jgi:hypothetical protein